jgi:hypothetical protein
MAVQRNRKMRAVIRFKQGFAVVIAHNSNPKALTE